jgi:hypothetical protein
MAELNAVLSDIPVGGPLTPQALAREYDPQSYADAWDAVEDYRRVQQLQAETGKKSGALASDLDLPRGRIRPWLDGGAPDAVHAVARTAELGWFAWGDSIAAAMATLVVAVRAGGSISAHDKRPYWTTEPEEAAAMVAAALQQVGVGVARDEREDRPDQLGPAHDGPVLGRALVVLGCEAGDTNEQSAPLPAWLLEASVDIRRPAARLFVMYRGVGFTDKDTIVLLSERSLAYRESVAQLFDGLVDGPVTAGERIVTISAQAARDLGFGRGMVLREAIE